MVIKKILNYNKDDSLIRDGFILFTATMFANLAAFFYHFYMGRVLGPADYGVLGAILSILYILTVPFNVIQTSVTKFIAEFRAKNEKNKIKAFFGFCIKGFAFYGFILLFVFLGLSYFIADYLKISVYGLFVFSPIVVFCLLLPVVRGFLQGQQWFKTLGLSIIIEAIVKLSLGLFLVYIEWHIYGAVLGIVFSFIAAFFIFYFYLRSKLMKGDIKNKTNDEKISFNSRELYGYGIPVLIAFLFLTFSYTIDVFIVKHYFSDIQAGYYAALSLIGKIVFFASASISTVMFPKVADLYARGKESKLILYKSMLFVFLIGIVIVLGYLFLPEFVVSVLLGNAYLEIAKYLWLFGIVMLFFSMNYLLVFYNLSVSRKKFLWILGGWFLLELLTIGFYHPSIYFIVIELILLNVLLFIMMLWYTLVRNGEAKVRNE